MAQAFGVDRSTIHAWQRRGLPYIDNGKGKPSAYVPPLVLRWCLAHDVAKDDQWGIKLTDGLSAVCFGYALDHDECGKPDRCHETLHQLQRCMDVTAERFFQAFGYYLAQVRQKRGLI